MPPKRRHFPTVQRYEIRPSFASRSKMDVHNRASDHDARRGLSLFSKGVTFRQAWAEIWVSHRESDEVRSTTMRRALALVMEALDMLDGFDGSAAAAAHLDMAVTNLRDALGETAAPDQPDGT